MTDPRTSVVAFLGTGTMGFPMARNLARAGFPVRAWNRTRAKAEPLAADGVTVVDTPAQAADGASYLVTMLFDADAVEQVVRDALPALPDGAIWLQMSTVGLAGTRRLAALAREHGVTYVDAPVVGTRQPAEEGKLTVLATAPADLRDRLAPVFDALAARTVWVDAGVDGASRLKLVVNNWLLALTEGVAESLALAEGLALDPQLFLDTIKGAPQDSRYAQLKGGMMIRRDFTPSFALANALKDARLVLEAADEAAVEMAVTVAVRRHMAKAVELGHGDEDMAATYYAHRPG
jgi:3-hydroxyisobutyrate dehydrogenase